MASAALWKHGEGFSPVAKAAATEADAWVEMEERQLHVALVKES